MKIFTLLLFISLFSIQTLSAQTYITPNTGVIWTLDDVADNSPTTITVSGNVYTMLENLVIAENDTLIIDADLTLSIDADLLLTVFGTFLVDSDEVIITAINTANPFDGLRFEEFSEINIQNTAIEFGGGLRVLTEDFTLNNCTLTNNVSGVSTGAVVSLSSGAPQITNNSFTFNELPAVSSPANGSVSAYIFNNYIEGNNQSNSNRPQINMGATAVSDTLKIIQNTIIGDPALDMVGGIAVANLVGGAVRVIIDDNTITNHRYGITVVGSNSFAYIRNNVIEDNNTQNLPMLGGSGISLNTSSGAMEVIAFGNEFRRNLWGITVIGTASINLGDAAENPGGNVFSENGNEGEIYALYNNTANTILAKNNCWIEGQPNTSADAEAVIFHSVDDPTLGEVIFDPVNCEVLSEDGFEFEDFVVYPNPVREMLHFKNTNSFKTIEIVDVQGRLLMNETINEGENSIEISLPTGIYFANFNNGDSRLVKKILVE